MPEWKLRTFQMHVRLSSSRASEFWHFSSAVEAWSLKNIIIFTTVTVHVDHSFACFSNLGLSSLLCFSLPSWMHIVFMRSVAALHRVSMLLGVTHAFSYPISPSPRGKHCRGDNWGRSKIQTVSWVHFLATSLNNGPQQSAILTALKTNKHEIDMQPLMEGHPAGQHSCMTVFIEDWLLFDHQD